MAFTITGRISENGPERSITWRNGLLTGDPLLVQMFNAAAVSFEGKRLRLGTSIGHTKNHLEHGESILSLCNIIFLRYSVDGDTGFIPPVQKGVIA